MHEWIEYPEKSFGRCKVGLHGCVMKLENGAYVWYVNMSRWLADKEELASGACESYEEGKKKIEDWFRDLSKQHTWNGELTSLSPRPEKEAK